MNDRTEQRESNLASPQQVAGDAQKIARSDSGIAHAPESDAQSDTLRRVYELVGMGELAHTEPKKAGEQMTTIKLDDGKYEFDIDDQTGLMTAARRSGEVWEAGFEQRFSKSFMSALWRIRDLEAAPVAARAPLTSEARSHLLDAAKLIEKHHPACGYAARAIRDLLAAPVAAQVPLDSKELEKSLWELVEQARAWEKAYRDSGTLYASLDSYKTEVEQQVRFILNSTNAAPVAPAAAAHSYERAPGAHREGQDAE